MAEKAYITPEVLKWARESARISVTSAASKLNVKDEKVEEWERGISFPTISQAEKLAKMYRRPFAVLFLPEIPKDFYPLQDFRRKGSGQLSTSSIFIIREIQQKQAWMRELCIDNKEPMLPFVGKFSINNDPQTVANDILQTLSISPGNYLVNPIKKWIDAAESNGIFISRTSFIHSRLTLDSKELQGFAIADEYAPFIFINSDDWNAPQVFTLVHELAHIWIAESGVSNHIEADIRDRDKSHPVEFFCNEVAANALMPERLIKNNINSKAFRNPNEIFKVSKHFGVSSWAFIYRLYNLNLINMKEYNFLKTEADKEFKAFLQREEEKLKKQKLKGKLEGPSYYLLQLNRNSRLFTQIVIDNFKNGFVEPTLASNLLNVQINKFPKLEAQMHR